MAQAESKIARRSVFAAAALVSTLAFTSSRSDEPLLALQRRREALQIEIEALDLDHHDYDREINRLCDLQSAVSAEMAELPTHSLAGARAKLGVVEELYDSPMHADGWDRRLFAQVLDWMDDAASTAVLA